MKIELSIKECLELVEWLNNTKENKACDKDFADEVQALNAELDLLNKIIKD